MRTTRQIEISGVITGNDDKWIYKFFDMQAFCPADLQLRDGEDVEIVINSCGGSVYAASEIYTRLKQHTGKTTGVISSHALSAATLIAMGVQHLRIAPTADFMVHNVSAGGRYGDYHVHAKTADVLKQANDTLANAYALKTRRSKADILELMDKESWLTPAQALELGFVDEILFTDDQTLPLIAAQAAMLPMEVIAGMQRKKLAIELDLLALERR